MPRQNLALALLNALGGIAVLGSYAYAFSYSSELRAGLWGGVPESLQPIYTVNMLLAAAGYFPFTWRRVVRALVGIGATGLLLLAFRFARTQGGVANWAAAIGSIPFFVQTAILDAIVWPAYYPH